VDQQIDALSQPDLQAAADGLLTRLRAHTRHWVDDDVAVLLAELSLAPAPALNSSPVAAASVRTASPAAP